jgi:hypothetical protein
LHTFSVPCVWIYYTIQKWSDLSHIGKGFLLMGVS